MKQDTLEKRSTAQLAVCVYCGSSDSVDPAFMSLGAAVGVGLARRGHTLVYGGGGSGLMGAVARGVHEGSGRVVGVIPRAMADAEAAYFAADELIFTDTMRQRKHEMDARADAFLVLPGGFGTLEELSEVVTHRYLKFHHKPIVILDHQGFYEPLLALFDHFIAHGFAGPGYRSMWSVVHSTDEALDALSTVVLTHRG